MELRLDADRTLNLQRAGGGWTGSVEEVPVHADTVVLAGTVESSLYAALLDGEGTRRAGARSASGWRTSSPTASSPGRSTSRATCARATASASSTSGWSAPTGRARSGRVLGVQFSINGRDHEAYAFTAPDGTGGLLRPRRRVAPPRLPPRPAGSSAASARPSPTAASTRSSRRAARTTASTTRPTRGHPGPRGGRRGGVARGRRPAATATWWRSAHKRGYTTRYAPPARLRRGHPRRACG